MAISQSDTDWYNHTRQKILDLHARCDVLEQKLIPKQARFAIGESPRPPHPRSQASHTPRKKPLNYDKSKPRVLLDHAGAVSLEYGLEAGEDEDGFLVTGDEGHLYQFVDHDPLGHEAFKEHVGREVETQTYNLTKHFEDDVDRFDDLAKDPMIRSAYAKRRRVTLKEAKDWNVLVPWYRAFIYWFVPPLIGFSSFIFQNVCLHINTAHYIEYMMAFEEVANATTITNRMNQMKDVGDDGLMHRNLERIGQGRLFDVLDEVVSTSFPNINRDMQISWTDAIAATPAMLFVSVWGFLALLKDHGDKNIGIWTKTFFVFAVMNVGKGLFDTATTVPDSAGWQKCKDRLTIQGVQAIENGNIGEIPFTASELLSSIAIEVLGYSKSGKGTRHVRFCSDMLSSGHTSLAVVFALGVRKMLASYLHSIPGVSKIAENIVLNAVNAVLCICVLVDVGVIGITRFHYAVDIALAIILALLWFDSIHLETCVSWWTRGFHWYQVDADLKKPSSSSRYKAKLRMLRAHDENPNEEKPPICDSKSHKMINLWIIRRERGLEAYQVHADDHDN